MSKYFKRKQNTLAVHPSLTFREHSIEVISKFLRASASLALLHTPNLRPNLVQFPSNLKKVLRMFIAALWLTNNVQIHWNLIISTLTESATTLARGWRVWRGLHVPRICSYGSDVSWRQTKSQSRYATIGGYAILNWNV